MTVRFGMPVASSRVGVAAVLAALSPMASADIICPEYGVEVEGAKASDATAVCDAAAIARDLFKQCGLPSLDRDIRIGFVEELEAGCMGVYHCGEDRIELLSLQKIEEIRSLESVFASVSGEAYFRSVVVHELSHASLEDMPCPFANCIVSEEYVAYALQIMSLPEQERTKLPVAWGSADQVSREDLSEVLLWMDPGMFTRNVWTHLSQQDDACSFIGDIARGTITLDRERFHKR